MQEHVGVWDQLVSALLHIGGVAASLGCPAVPGNSHASVVEQPAAESPSIWGERYRNHGSHGYKGAPERRWQQRDGASAGGLHHIGTATSTCPSLPFTKTATRRNRCVDIDYNRHENPCSRVDTCLQHRKGNIRGTLVQDSHAAPCHQHLRQPAPR